MLDCLDGWIETSIRAGFQIAADDFVLTETSAIAGIHWWGGYLGWLDNFPPPVAPSHFHIAVWTHEDAGQGVPPAPFARPDTVLQDWFAVRGELAETYVACAVDSGFIGESGSAFFYRWTVPEEDRFTAVAGTRYWLTIAATYVDPSCPCDADVAAPLGTYDQADEDFVAAQVGCTVGSGDPDCDAADVNCDGLVDADDVAIALCQRIAAWGDPACCVPGTLERPWGWVTRQQGGSNSGVRVFSPTDALPSSSFGDGETCTDSLGTPAEFSFVLASSTGGIVQPDPPLADPLGIERNRYLTLQPPASWAGVQIALRVQLVSLNDFPAHNGSTRWAGPPVTYADGAAPMFTAAELRCDPSFESWNVGEALHLHGIEVEPRSVYEVQSVHESCASDLGNEACYAAPLTIATAEWGDVVAPFGGASQPNFGDISAVVDKFRALATAIPKVQAQLQPDAPDPAQSISFQDISRAVDAFRNFPYPFAGPTPCP